MAQFRLHGKKAIIIQTFNSMPNIYLMEFEWNFPKGRKTRLWDTQ